MTRLTAAVKGAGGGVADAELAFKNINSAIIATGGGAEQVQGAVTALVQIFSKGKVSAEEINQIAERLPGTFNKIAAASGRTGPELTKALQDGKVGLNDLMKFLVSLGDEYGELAEKIAASSENAGARLQIAFNNMRIEVGDALQPIGAEFQDAFTEFIEDITPTLVAVLPKIGELALALTKNIDVLAGAMAGLAAAMVAVNFKKFIDGIIAVKAVATGAKFGALLLNPWVALAAGIGAAVVALSRYERKAISVANAVKAGDEASRIAAFKNLSDISGDISLLEKEKKQLEIDMPSGYGREVARLSKDLTRLRGDRDALKEALRLTAPVARPDGLAISTFPSVDLDKGTSVSGKGAGGDRNRQAELGERLLRKKRQELELLLQQDPLERKLLRIRHEQVDAMEQVKNVSAEQREELKRLISDIAQGEKNFAFGESLGKMFVDTGKALDVVRSGFAEGAKIDEELRKANEEADIFKQTMESVGEILGTTMIDAIDGLIDGTASLNDVLSDVLKQVSSLLLNAGLNAYAGPIGSGGILSFLGFGTEPRANGGPTYANRPYLIGERGPEIFVPSQSGRVLPNSSLGGANVVVNVDASGTNAQGDSQDASKLGNVIGAAVQSELIKQQRPGGLLAR